MEVGLEYQATCCRLLGTVYILYYMLFYFLFNKRNSIEVMFYFNIVVGNRCLWISGDCDFMVHQDEGPTICVCIQPPNALVCHSCCFSHVG